MQFSDKKWTVLSVLAHSIGPMYSPLVVYNYTGSKHGKKFYMLTNKNNLIMSNDTNRVLQTYSKYRQERTLRSELLNTFIQYIINKMYGISSKITTYFW